MKAGQIIGQTLKAYDIDYIFGLTGGDHPMWFGLRDAGMKYVLTHSERAAVAMADAYARLTGKPSVAYGQWGPGAALCVSGVADAYWAHSPLICINSDTNSSSLYRYCYQEISDQQSLFAPITKWNVRVPDVSRLPDLLRTAIRMAVSGVPGPVHIDIPREMTRSWSEDIDVQIYADPECKKSPAYRVAPESSEIEEAIAMIAEAQKPLLVSGGGVVMSEAWNELVQFAESLSIPVVASASGKSAIPTDHPLAVGVIGHYSRKVANDVAAECDTCIVIGSNLGDMTTKQWQLPVPAAKLIHIDMDPGVLGANLKTDLAINADARLALQAMLETWKSSASSKKTCRWADWVSEVQSKVSSWKAAFEEKARDGGADGAVNPYSVINALNKVISPDDVVVADTGYMAAYGAALLDVKAPGRNYLHAAGSLGYGLPMALGAQYAVEDKSRVICLIGDGGMGYHAPEIETAVRLNLPVVVLVLNNSSLGFTANTLKYNYKDPLPEVTDYLDIDYGAVARAFGAYGERVRSSKDLEGALRKALDSGKPAVIDVSIDKDICGPVTYYEKTMERRV